MELPEEFGGPLAGALGRVIVHALFEQHRVIGQQLFSCGYQTIFAFERLAQMNTDTRCRHGTHHAEHHFAAVIAPKSGFGRRVTASDFPCIAERLAPATLAVRVLRQPA